MEKNRKFCPFCEKESELIHLKSKEEWILGDIHIDVDVPFYRCPLCKEEFCFSDDCDPYSYAYQQYEKITGKKWTGGEASTIQKEVINYD